MAKIIDDKARMMGSYDSHSREGMIKMMDNFIATVPDEFKNTVMFVVDTYEEEYSDSSYGYMYAAFKRYETPKEKVARELKEADDQKRRDAWDLQQYKALQKKFEGKV